MLDTMNIANGCVVTTHLEKRKDTVGVRAEAIVVFCAEGASLIEMPPKVKVNWYMSPASQTAGINVSV